MGVIAEVQRSVGNWNGAISSEALMSFIKLIHISQFCMNSFVKFPLTAQEPNPSNAVLLY